MMGKCVICGIEFNIKQNRTCGRHVTDRSRYKNRYKDRQVKYNQAYYNKHKDDPHFQLMRRLQVYKSTPRLALNSWLL